MERNKNLDLVRAFAILSIVIYHIYALTGIQVFHNEFLNKIVAFAGEYGVTTFLILSGFCIYKSIEKSGENFKYKDFIKKRMKRLLPQYYFALLIILIFSNMAVYICKNNIMDLFTHIFLFHNIYPLNQGSICGSFWTIGLIFQFYLISPILFRCINKKPKTTLIVSSIFSIVMKFFIFHFILSRSVIEINGFYYFCFSKILLTSIDNFVIGMFLGKIIKNREKYSKKMSIINVIGLILSLILLFKSLEVLNSMEIQLYSDSNFAYVYHFILAIILGLMIYFFSHIKIPLENIIGKFLLFIAKYEYGIYIWHFSIIVSLSTYSNYFIELISLKRRIVYILFGTIIIIVGMVMTEIIDTIDLKKFYLKVKDTFKWMLKILFGIFGIILVVEAITVLPETYLNFKYASDNNIEFNTKSKLIAENAAVQIEENKKYAYIDISEESTAIFWELRYLLSPRECIHYNSYASQIRSEDESILFEAIYNLDVDYYIIGYCPTLNEFLDINIDLGTIFKKNKDATSLENLFLQIYE